MHLTSQQLVESKLRKMAELREKFFRTLGKGGGVETIRRNLSIKFDEPHADCLDVLSIFGYPVSVLDQVTVNPQYIGKWGMGHVVDCRDFNWRLLENKIFRIVAFVELTANPVGNMRCRGYFCVLSELDPTNIIADDAGKFDSIERICCGQEVGRKMGKVTLYPIECLVPVKALPEAEKPRSISEEYADELKYIAGNSNAVSRRAPLPRNSGKKQGGD